MSTVIYYTLNFVAGVVILVAYVTELSVMF
jgi:hypothetical protein